MEEINAIVGKRYYLSMYRQGFGNYWMEIEVVKVVDKGVPPYYSNGYIHEYSILYRKFNDPCPYSGDKNPVWVHHETVKTWNRRVLDI